MTSVPLSTIIALARAGALDHAWSQFSAAGYGRDEDDPAALTVKGRLLKDHALRASGDARRRFYLQSADAYQRSAALQPATYPLINAATLSLLSGDRARAQEIAREVLERIACEPDEPETPYYRAATEAEALLLLGQAGEAKTALEAAVAAAPRAWEDHASTLRQFLIVQDALGGRTEWLDMLRPPRSLHYAGAAALAVEADRAALEEAVASLLDAERIGFGFGGLAAGAELVVAEALLARGAELHVILPADPAGFAARFVDPHGAAWRARFDAALEAAETVELVRPLQAPPDPRQAVLAGEVARGAAMLNAERLMSEAVLLRVGVDPGAPTGLRTHLILPPAGLGPPQEESELADESRVALFALLAVSVGSGADAAFEDRLEDVQEALARSGGVRIAPHLGGDSIIIGYDGPLEAAAAARAIHAALRARMPLRVAGHYGLIPCVRDPFIGALRPTESGTEIVRAIARAIPPDTLCVSHDFAAALAARAAAPSGANWIGELQAFDGGSAIGLYALRPD
ncbi:MAG TPA: tetratricopeptide repeat-containing protein [Allosphingosinicella sp.]|nr:tetratricopeptide repeat-containing protein [Allosphingosinicella sp.]